MTRRAHLLPLRILLVAAMLASCASSGVRVARSDQAAAPPPTTTTATSPTTTATFDDGTSRYLAIDTNVVVVNNHSCLNSPIVEG